MTRRAGHTLVELLACMAGLSALVGAALSIGLQAERDRRLANGLGNDTMALRRAADAIERDVRGATRVSIEQGSLTLGAVTWRVDSTTLLRGDERVATRVAAFEALRDAEGAVHVRIELAPRTAGASRRATVATTVRPRVEGVPR